MRERDEPSHRFTSCFFYLWHQSRDPVHDQQESAGFLNIALDQYLESPNVAAVMEALSAAVCTYQADSIFERSRRMANLTDTIVKLILQHRLRMSLMIVGVSLICLSSART